MKNKRIAITYGTLILMVIVLIVLNIHIGSVSVPVENVLKILMGNLCDATQYNVIWKIRLPRAAAAFVLGGALALAGFLLQTYFNNPIAGPYILGISSGAKLTVALAMIILIGNGHAAGSAVLVLAAFAGAMMSVGFIIILADKIKNASTLIVGGVMIGYICSAVTDFMVTFADESDIVNLHNWSLGSFSGMAWRDVFCMTVIVFVVSVIVFGMSKAIGAYLLGEEYARSVGVNVKSFRIMLVILSSILAACVTAFAGPISFVGIAVPHLIKRCLNTSKPIVVIPACFLGGSAFCLGCDLISRTLFAPVELNISSVTAVFGAPVVIAVMLKKRGGRR